MKTTKTASTTETRTCPVCSAKTDVPVGWTTWRCYTCCNTFWRR